MNTRCIRFSLLFTLTMMLSACGTSDLILSSFDGSNSVNVQVEVADNAKERTQGLMNRAELKADTGMLFIFPKPHVLTFWMKNTKIPLEILFFDAEGAFVNAYTMQPCIEDPCDTYKAAALSAYALEVNPGFREMNGIGVGWKLDPKEVAKISKPQ